MVVFGLERRQGSWGGLGEAKTDSEGEGTQDLEVG